MVHRPFSHKAEILCRGYSEPLQKAMTDFGAESAYNKVSERLFEHYGINVPTSAARVITQKHAKIIRNQTEDQRPINKIKKADYIVSETDGTMVPIITFKPTDQQKTDRRKTRTVAWKEIRLTLAYQKGSLDMFFESSMDLPDKVGEKMSLCISRSGLASKTKVHCVGDGAPWIADQVEKQLGSQGKFTLDFFHVSEYLAIAAKCLPLEVSNNWLLDQQNKLKKNETASVLAELQKHGSGCLLKNECPAMTCYNYMIKRTHQLDYKTAIDRDLPIGSGEIESAHRYIIQKRVKIPGAWWLPENADSMVALQVSRANREWNHYWESRNQSSA